MKKLSNVIALFILVSVNILTPISYAQENESEVVEPRVTKTIAHDAEIGIIKFKYGEDEVRIKDKNVGAENPTMTGKAYELMQLVRQMCGIPVAAEPKSLNVAVSEAPELPYVCDDEFAATAIDIVGEGININTYSDAMNYIFGHSDATSNAYGDYYWWGNDGYAKYDELSCQATEYLGVESLDNECLLNVASSAVKRGFMNGYNYNNYGWYEGGYENPCDASKGEYLPGPSDREQLIDVWGNINGIETRYLDSLGSRSIDGMYIDLFMRDLMIPNAGYVLERMPIKNINPTVNALYNLEYHNNPDYLWTAYSNSEYAGNISMDDDNGIRYKDSIEGRATPVRCFVATDPVTVTFKFNNGQPDKVLKIQKGNYLAWPEDIPEKEDSVFEGWYVGDEEYDFYENVGQDLTIVAHWTECEDGQVVKNNRCMYEVEHDVDRGLLKVTDGQRTVYIKDRNVGAEVSAGLSKAEKVETILKNMCNYYDGLARGKSIRGNDGEYRDCSVNAYEEVAKLLNVNKEIINDDYISEYLYNYYNSEEYLDYMQSFGNYYYRGNDEKYDTYKCELQEPSLLDGVQVMKKSAGSLSCWIDSDNLSGNLSNTGWNGNVGANNPCNGAGEYLPTLEDWAELMDIWAVNNVNYEFHEKLLSVAAESPIYPYISYQYVPQFQEDLLIPSAGQIFNGCNMAVEAAVENSCLSYYNGAYLWSSRNENNVFGNLYHINGDDLFIYPSKKDDNMANPVRCFVDIEAMVHTITFDTAGGTPVNPITQEYNTTIKTAPKTTKAGYTFDGWYDGDQKVSFPYTVSGDKILVAHWTENKGNGYSGGGGGSSKPTKTEPVDKHNSADEKKTEPEIKKEEGKNIKIITDAPVNTEKETFNAHQWAYSKGLTKYRTSSEARMDDFLNRSEMAKISSIFATEFLDKTPNEKKKEFCSQYSDMWKVEDDMKFFITESCELGYMGYESNGIDALERFRPYTPLTVAETATILSRIVWGNENAMNGKDWYKGHLYATYNHGLIDDIKDPTTRSITRREAYTMLYRLINMME